MNNLDSEKTKMKESKKKKPVVCYLSDGKVLCFKDFESVYLPGYYGKILDNRLELSLVEALYLIKKGRIKVYLKDKGKKSLLDFEKFYEIACKKDERFPFRYRVYEDLRERGLLVKTGFKFGCDFRCYERGVELKKGPKTQKEHTKWVVFCVPEDYKCSFYELSRAVRLAHNIRARMLWAIVDGESDITYYEVCRILP
jgi:tRNA-intron endonuclease